ncbi:hypothetical protein BC940DRAFT_297738 [Gongronella butleri]|nr:hypothetical protein BC940DRAFT_297738 [Gongronella butleri]
MLMEPLIAPPLLNERTWDHADVFLAKLFWQSYWDGVPVSIALFHDAFTVLHSSLILLGKSDTLGVMNIESGEIEHVTNLQDRGKHDGWIPYSVTSIDNSKIFMSCSCYIYQCSVQANST